MAKTIVLVIAIVFIGVAMAADLEELFAWKEMEFTWPDAATKENALQDGTYVPINNLPLGIERWRNKLFITVPRWKDGVASSLNYIQLEPNNKVGAITPYPNWESNTAWQRNQTITDDSIVSVFRVRVDACDRLWVMDTGVADLLGNTSKLSNPSLVIFDLKTDRLIRRYEFKATDVEENSFFANIVVDVTPETCDKAYAYMPDLGGYGLVVYSLLENDSWRVKHNFFHFDPLQGDLTVGGVNFQWTDGVFGLALSNIKDDGYRTMYFHALASTKEFSVSTEILRNKTAATDPHNYFAFKCEGDRGEKTQSSANDIDSKTGVMFLTQLNRDGVACWNPKKPLNPENLGLVVQDKERLIFTNDIKIDNEQNLFILSDKMPAFIYRELNPEEVNYRIFKVKVEDAIKGTPCE